MAGDYIESQPEDKQHALRHALRRTQYPHNVYYVNINLGLFIDSFQLGGMIKTI
jgi:hypothetical protein